MNNLDQIPVALAEFARTATEKITAATKQVEDLAEKQREHTAVIHEIEQKMVRRPGGGESTSYAGSFDLASALNDSAGFAALRTRNSNKASIRLPAGALHTNCLLYTSPSPRDS